ncbi:cullin [Trypanosoma brucei equiperdum]|uniref:Cullin n=1 Tax=Trypanosoma brucei equiperdum TaxID=630700 RepID=A0A3L6LCP8_9TRYP|nr:cullin [Trypanosoma brucei equiperdum]
MPLSGGSNQCRNYTDRNNGSDGVSGEGVGIDGGSDMGIEVDVSAWLVNMPQLGDLWPRVEEYLTRSAAKIRNSGAYTKDPLKGIRHRMSWYAVIYYACAGHPQRFCEIYQYLALFLLNDLETNALPPVLSAVATYGDTDPELDVVARREGFEPPLRPNRSLLQEFVHQFRLFMLFRRVVLSCFGYLDQWYTEKFHLDPVSDLCVKMFYVVVYERVRDGLASEIVHSANQARGLSDGPSDDNPSNACLDVQAALAVVSEIVSTVRASSTNTEAGVVHCGPLGKEGSNPSIDGGRSDDVEVEAGTSAPCQTGTSPWELVPDRIPLLREKLESGSLMEFLKSLSASTGGNQCGGAKVDGTSAARPSGAACGALLGGAHPARSFIVSLVQPLHTLLLDQFGTRYVRAAEAYYRKERSVHLSTREGRNGYVTWVRSCYRLEQLLVKDMRAPFFHDLLCARLHRVLLLEVHSEIILDDEFGFRALLDAWSAQTSPHFGALRKDFLKPVVVSSPSSSLEETVHEIMDRRDCASSLQHIGKAAGSMQPMREGLASALGLLVTTFADTQSEICIALLRHELANKVVMDSVPLLATYFVMEEKHHLGHIHPRGRQTNDVEPAFLRDMAKLVVGGLVDIVAQYGNLVQVQFHSLSSMLVAVRDALREVLNPHRWERHTVDTRSGVNVNSGKFSDMLLLEAERQQPPQIHGYEPTRGARAALRKLAAMRDGRSIPMSRLVAVYCDVLVSQSGTRGVAVTVDKETDIGGKCVSLPEGSDSTSDIDSVTALAALLDDKDVFLEEYKQLLARRLIILSSSLSLSPSALPTELCTKPNAESEHAMIRELRRTFGRTSTLTLKMMLHDYTLSCAMGSAFRQTPSAQQLKSGINVQVITGARWPTYSTVPLLPCTSLAAAISTFSTYYAAAHPLRTLSWIHSQGTANLEALFPNGSKEIVADTIQSNILILLSDAYNTVRRNRDSESRRGVSEGESTKRYLTGQEIASAMGMSFENLYAYLNQLVHHTSYKLITRVPSPNPDPAVDPNEASVRPEYGYTINVDFKHSSNSFRLPVPHPRWNQKASGGHRVVGADAMAASQTFALVTESTRRLQVDAAIVRTMKRHRSLPYHELMSTTVQELSRFFVPSTQFVKVQVEGLIAREFLKRNEANSQLLEYVV